MVFAPLVILSAIFVAASGVLLFGNRIDADMASTTFIAILAIYAAAVALLGRIGLGHFANLENIGLTDSLSSLPNRRALHVDVELHIRKHADVTIALIDLDGFKMVNDLYGHAVGDEVVRLVGEELQAICGNDAKPYRLGGDEFALCASGPLSSIILEGICRNLLERLAQPLAVEDRRITIGASIGLSSGKAGSLVSSSELLRRADVAMYVSKRAGKMRCSWFNADHDHDLERFRHLNDDLRNALVNDEFKVHFQPLVDAKDKRVVAVEALLRWQRADGKMVEPSAFIPAAEESGLINAIGLLVLRQACTDAIDWRDITLAVNISAAQLRNTDFPIQLGQILEETGFPPERLELEITETCLILDPVVAERSLNLIRSFGVTVALDDFGTGYASIGFLRQFRFEKLKLDRSLVSESTQDESSRAMMLSSISMARALNMLVTAEGVETEAQAEMVRSAGCDHIQGWLYFQAMPAKDIAQHLIFEPTNTLMAQAKRRLA